MQNLYLLMGILSLLFLPYSNCSPLHERSLNSTAFDTGAILQSLQTKSLQILNLKCASCHNNTVTDNAFTNANDISFMISNDYIDAGVPQTSRLYLKLIDGHNSINPNITSEELAVLRDWIAALGGNFNTVIGGIETPTTSAPGAPGTFLQVQSILQQRCVNCHNGQRKPNLSLSYAQLLTETTSAGLRIITPALVGDSRLYGSVVTNSMPTGNPLSNEQKELIRSWIAAGAPNN